MIERSHILVVEDELHLATGIKFNLERESYHVTVVSDGPAALRLMDENPNDISLILLDLMLPGMSGYEVCEKIRESNHTTPILILSARTLAEDRARGFDVGADQYMMKPFDLDELLSRVKNLLQLSLRRGSSVNPPSTEIAYVGKSKVDFTTYEAHVRGAVVRLTPLQVKLLQFFVANEGRVIPREELLENVWNLPGHVNTRAPDQFMRRLRKIFEDDPAQPRHFLTIRDTGYRFIAQPEDSVRQETPSND